MIKVDPEPEGLSAGIHEMEECCFCFAPTTYWYHKKDVACCKACARTHTHIQVPNKIDWIRAAQFRAKRMVCAG